MQRMRWKAAAILLAASGCSASPPDLSAGEAWARASAGSSAAVYLAVENRGGSDDRLVGVSSPRGSASLHRTETANGIARMRPVPPEGLEVPAGGTLTLRPHGAHVMLTGLGRPLRAGERFALSLEFRQSPRRTVAVQVIDAEGPADGSH